MVTWSGRRGLRIIRQPLPARAAACPWPPRRSRRCWSFRSWR